MASEERRIGVTVDRGRDARAAVRRGQGLKNRRFAIRAAWYAT
jgi:hypothetical protein